MSESAPNVALQGASKSYGAVRALREADIELRAGEVLLGPPTVFDKSNIDQFDF